MFNYPFLTLNNAPDPFENSLAQQYDLFYPQNQHREEQIPKEDVPKAEAATSPCYIHDEPQQQPELLETVLNQTKKAKKAKVIIKGREDDDYKPYRRSRKQKKGKIVRQKQDRNLIPNTVHHILAFVQKRFKSVHLANKIFDFHNHSNSYNLTRFYIFHKMLRVKINNYVNEDALNLICEPGQINFDQFDEDEQTFYCFVSRILMRHFLKSEAIIMILISKKVKRQNIMEHLRVQRFLYQNLTACEGL